MNHLDFRKIRALLLDSDGVLTDGGVFYDETGRTFRRFDIKDGAGLRAVMKSGRLVAIISSAEATPVTFRAKQLGISECHVGVKEKLPLVRTLCQRHGVPLDSVAFVGDDRADLPVLKEVGFPMSVADGMPVVRKHSVYVSERLGGHGAVREICDKILDDTEADSAVEH